jgi:hypothetical protein
MNSYRIVSDVEVFHPMIRSNWSESDEFLKCEKISIVELTFYLSDANFFALDAKNLTSLHDLKF